MAESLPVLIAGAGPTGLTAAIELSRMGVPVRIVDKIKEFSTTSRALAVQARTLELFEQRGLADEMLRIGNAARGTSIYADGKLLGRIDLTLVPSPFNMILLLAQSETERLLREQLGRQGVTVERETELIAVGQNADATTQNAPVRAVLKKADSSLEEIEAAYLIATEGAHSSVRHTLNLEFRGKSLPHTYALADIHLDGPLSEDDLTVFLGEKGLLASFPMGNQRFRVIASLQDASQGAERTAAATKTDQHTKGEGYAPHAEPSVEEMQHLWDAGSHIPVRMHDMVWSSSFRINSRMVDRLRIGRIFLGGDSAHVHSPAGGQGMNTGIQDMINLAWKLAMVYKGVAKPELLDTYEQERLPLIQGIVSKTEGVTDILDSESRWTHLLVTHIAPIALGSDTVKHKSAGILSQVEGNYRKSPVSAKRANTGIVYSGDRLPPAMFEAQDGSHSFLSALDPDRFTLLSLSEASTQAFDSFIPTHFKTQSVRLKTDGRALGSADLILLRPDGYIAWIGTHEQSAELTEWCRTWFIEGPASSQS